MLILKKELRSTLRRPFGRLYPSLDDLGNLLSGGNLLISVGDVTTKNLLDAGITPDISVIDYKIKRKPSKYKIEYDAVILHAKNSPGTITDELWDVIKEGIDMVKKSKKNVLIVVDGEEDLSVLPCVLESSEGSLILYGQPGEGIVLVEVDKVKDRAKNLIKKFKEVKNGD